MVESENTLTFKINEPVRKEWDMQPKKTELISRNNPSLTTIRKIFKYVRLTKWQILEQTIRKHPDSLLFGLHKVDTVRNNLLIINCLKINRRRVFM